MPARATAAVLVGAQLALLAALVVAAWAHGPEGVPWLGWVVVGLGAAFGIWGGASLGKGLTASPLPNGRIGLVATGPYALTRHPIYSALLYGGLGVVIWSGWWGTGVVWLLLTLLLAGKAAWEERHLAAVFPGYADYAARTPRFLGLGSVQQRETNR